LHSCRLISSVSLKKWQNGYTKRAKNPKDSHSLSLRTASGRATKRPSSSQPGKPKMIGKLREMPSTVPFSCFSTTTAKYPTYPIGKRLRLTSWESGESSQKKISTNSTFLSSTRRNPPSKVPTPSVLAKTTSSKGSALNPTKFSTYGTSKTRKPIGRSKCPTTVACIWTS
jgi:hypothetical protein